MNIDLNSARCLVEKQEFGVTAIHNICSGVVTRIDWTIADWAEAFAMLVLVSILAAIVVFFAFFVWDAITR